MEKLRNRNLSVVYSSVFMGLPILNCRNGLYKEYLESNLEVMEYICRRYSKVFSVRIDLRLPSGYNPIDTNVISRFIGSLKSQIKADYLSKIRLSEGLVHQSELFNVWVKEVGENNNTHYHVCLFFNGNAYRSLGVFEFGRNNMYNRIYKAWASALKLNVYAVQGLVHVPDNAEYLLIRNQKGFDFIFQNLFRRLSYFAKTDSKEFGDRSRHYGSSRCN